MEAEFASLLDRKDIPKDVRIILKKIRSSYISRTREIKRMKQRLKELIEDSPVGILEVDVVKRQLISVNDIACEQTGYTKEEILSLDPFDLLPEETKNYFIKRQISLLSGEDIKPRHVELKLHKKDGSQFWVSVRTKFTFDDQGNIERATMFLFDITERKEAEMALKDSEEKYRTLFESTPAFIAILDLNGCIIDCNKRVSEFTGFSKEKLIRRHFSKLNVLKEVDVKKYTELLPMIQTEPDTRPINIDLNDNMDVIHNFEIIPTFLRKDNIINAIQIIGFDVTSHRQIEKNLRDSEQRYRRLSEAAFEGIIIHDQGVIIEANQTYAKLLGYDLSEITGSNGLEHAAPESRELIIKNILNGSEEPYEAMALRKDGTTFPVEIRAKIARYLGKEVRVTAFRDLSEQKKAEEAIRNSEEKYRELFHNANDPIFLLEFDEGIPGKIIEVNDIACRRLEYSREELLKMSPHDFSDPDILQAVLPIIKQDFLTRGNTTFEMIHIPRSSDPFPVEINSHLFTFKGRPVALSIARDISERKETEKMRIDLENRRKRFIETTSHELRTPLTNAKGFIELLQAHEEDFTQEEKVECYSFIQKNLSRLEMLIRDVSDLTKIDRLGIRIEKKVIDFCQFLNENILAYKRLLEDHFMVKSNCKTEILLEIDEDRFSQVLDNIIDNAIKHTPKDSRKIEMNVNTYPEIIQITISDNGAGIESSNLTKIFEPFIAIETKYSVVGAGIGLYLSRKIVKSHGGTIQAHSDGLDQGATFTIEIPRIDPGK